MANALVLKRGDRKPSFRGQCLDGTTPVDLTLATTAKLILKSGAATAVTVTVVIEDVLLGKVRYDWTAGDLTGVLATSATYRAEVEVTWGDGTKQTFPGSDYATVIVIDDLG
jgi:hypothetical protein